MSFSALLIPSDTGTSINFFPSNRSIGTFVSAATMMQSASRISSSVSTFLAPPDPLVSTLIKQPFAFAVFSKDSAAIKVCAIPVGHPVTARILICPFFASSFGAWVLASFSFSASSITLRNSCGDFADFNAAVNSSFISIPDNLLKISICVEPLFGLAAIKNNRSTGSSSRAS